MTGIKYIFGLKIPEAVDILHAALVGQGHCVDDCGDLFFQKYLLMSVSVIYFSLWFKKLKNV